MKTSLYHGTDEKIAKIIVKEPFQIKKSPYHWLGNGIYFYLDRDLAAWWTTNPSKKFGINVEKPAIVKADIEIEDCEVLDLRIFSNYVKISKEFEKFFTELYIPYHKTSIDEKSLKCLFFDYYFLAHKEIKMIIGEFVAEKQEYVNQEQKDFLKHTNLLYGEIQICLRQNCQDVIINKEVVAL